MTINGQLIEKFKSNLIDEEKSQATIEKYIRDVTAFFAWLPHSEIEKKTSVWKLRMGNSACGSRFSVKVFRVCTSGDAPSNNCGEKL